MHGYIIALKGTQAEMDVLHGHPLLQGSMTQQMVASLQTLGHLGAELINVEPHAPP